MIPTELWTHIHTERGRVLDLLESLEPADWSTMSECSVWTVEQVTAHLTAAANTGTWAWIRSIVRARFNADVHNDRLLARRLGPTPEATRDRFRASVPLTIAPTKDLPAFLGEVIVHGQDMARPLGRTLVPDPAAVREVARFYAAKDFAVNSHRMVRGLRLEADDDAFTTGDGPIVSGPLLDLVLAMAGRRSGLDRLRGPGVDGLRERLS